MTENVLETIEGAKTIRAYGREDDDFKKTKIAIDNDVNSWWKILKFEAVYTPLFECVYLVAYTIAICLGSYYVIQGDITAGSLVTYLIYVGMLSSPLITLSTILNIVNNVGIADERYYEILNKKPKVYDEEDSKTIKTFKTIEFKDVTFRYSFDTFDVIKNISFTINNGETIGIVGPTGSGKSTLIRQLLREFNITSGNILIDSENDILLLKDMAKKYSCVKKIELLPFRKICQTKYDSMNIPFPLSHLPESTVRATYFSFENEK